MPTDMTTDMTTEPRVKITPELAARFLGAVEAAGRTNYRKTRPYYVKHYARQMEAGRWLYTAANIYFDRDGILVDGFHRLNACVLTGVPIEVNVILNTPPEVVALLDRGTPRTDADVATLFGWGDAKSLIAFTARVLEWDNGLLGTASRLRMFDPQDKLDVASVDRDLTMASLAMGRRIWKATHISKAMGAAFYWKVACIDREAADRFCEYLVVGAHLDAEDPILALRSWCSSRWAAKQRTSDEMWAHALTKTWNKWRNNEPMKLLKVSVSGVGTSRTPLPDLV